MEIECIHTLSRTLLLLEQDLGPTFVVLEPAVGYAP
jgi:hypothetical protein